MTDHDVFDDLIGRLERFGDALGVDDTDVTDVVLHRIGTTPPAQPSRRTLVAAAIVLAVTAAVLVPPGSRQAVARWFGFDRLVVEIDPDLPIRAPSGAVELPGPGESRRVDVAGREILVSAVGGTWNDGLITKSVGSSDQIEPVDVGGLDGLWFSGAPHEVFYEAGDGRVVVDRVAANTLVWQDGDVLYRVEGFATLDEALRFVEGGT